MHVFVCLAIVFSATVVVAQIPAPITGVAPIVGAPVAPQTTNATNTSLADSLTFLPDSGEFDNAATDTELVKTLPEDPSCTVRGQTVFEVRKMRADAKQIGLAVLYEIQAMEKRKSYVEQMTSYLNDRIRELNKVKTDLDAEQRWIQISNARISELAQKEKLIKLQDVMSCIRDQQSRLSGDATMKNSTLTTLEFQKTSLNNNLNAIGTKIRQIMNNTV